MLKEYTVPDFTMSFSIRVIPTLLAVSMLFSNYAYAAFIISGERNCGSPSTYSYEFSESVMVDVTVVVSQSVLMPDITMQLVNSPEQADLVFIDDFNSSNIRFNSDMKVCKAGTLAIGSKTIMVSDSSVMPDITVSLSEAPLMPDYKIFIRSNTFSEKEAAALFAVIWRENRTQLSKAPRLSGSQLIELEKFKELQRQKKIREKLIDEEIYKQRKINEILNKYYKQPSNCQRPSHQQEFIWCKNHKMIEKKKLLDLISQGKIIVE